MLPPAVRGTHSWIAMLLVVLVLAMSSAAPLYRTTGESYFEAGREHGRLAKSQIRRWLNGSEMGRLQEWVRTKNGSEAFQSLKATNSRQGNKEAREACQSTL